MTNQKIQKTASQLLDITISIAKLPESTMANAINFALDTLLTRTAEAQNLNPVELLKKYKTSVCLHAYVHTCEKLSFDELMKSYAIETPWYVA
jgi:hypothetical protein